MCSFDAQSRINQATLGMEVKTRRRRAVETTQSPCPKEVLDCPRLIGFRFNALQATQTGQPTRPQASHNRRRTLRGTLRIVTNRERSWGPVSVACLEEGHAGVCHRRVKLIGDPAVVA